MANPGNSFERVLATLSADPSIEFGVPGAKVEVLRTLEGPFSSVQQVRVRTPDRTTHAYIKIVKPRRAGDEELARVHRVLEREYRSTLAFYEAHRQDAAIGAVRPLAWLPEHRALVTEEVPGRPFGELLVDSSRDLEELAPIAARVGRWVRAYQNIGTVPGSVELSERRGYLDDRLTLLEGRVLSPAERGAVLSRFDSLAATLGPALPAVAIHADLTPMNIIADWAGRVTVLDFMMAKSGTRHHDLSHVYFHLEMMAARHRKRSTLFRALQRVMLEGYDPALSPDDPLFRLMLLQHSVCHVALLAERRLPVLDVAYRWFLKRRWHACGLPGAADRLTA